MLVLTCCAIVGTVSMLAERYIGTRAALLVCVLGGLNLDRFMALLVRVTH